MAASSGEAYGAIDSPTNRAKPAGNQQSAENRAMPPRESTQLFTDIESKQPIRVASRSPHRARICDRRIRQLNSHSASPEDINQVLHGRRCGSTLCAYIRRYPKSVPAGFCAPLLDVKRCLNVE
ncbi:hypothetical protein FN846DRAFT_893336 [Sphaerosporella brunnea]|uniref:Uncharacterized protein n=1 Tax=Sphaerosporella brunnea TaxID=1250544 RepID=A0A5J5EMS9_9PEZI|nr:hypothetical protein FN846DRAFT_893336 [Sphaerosporella brunnea]